MNSHRILAVESMTRTLASAPAPKDAPGFQLMLAVRRELLKRFSMAYRPDIEKMIGRMTLSADEYDAEVFAPLITVFCDIIQNVYRAMIDEGFERPLQVLVEMGPKFKLEL